MKYYILSFTLCFLFVNYIIAQEQNKRYVLLEEFSNTYCPPCIFRHPTFNENILDNYEDQEVFHISYHLGSPIPDDIFYQANIAEVEERANYYQVPGTPTLHLLGKFSPSGPSPDYDILPTPILQNYTGSISPLKIEVEETFTENNQRNVHIEVKTVNQLIPSNQFRLRLVVVEKTVEYEPPFEGMEAKHHNIFRQTLGGWEGTPFSPAKVGKTIEYDYTFSVKDAWQDDQIYVIAFVQDDSNQSILNAGSSWKNETVDIENQAIPSSIRLYPNPSSDYLFLDAEEKPQSVQMFDIQGQLLQNTPFDYANSSMDIRNLPKGVYFVSIQWEGEKLVEKIVKW
ncbi:MAG: T9SS type A sorting domain-containing protein [Chitinophagales bacterium]